VSAPLADFRRVAPDIKRGLRQKVNLMDSKERDMETAERLSYHDCESRACKPVCRNVLDIAAALQKARKEVLTAGIVKGLRMAAGIAEQVVDPNTDDFCGEHIADLIDAKARELSLNEDKGRLSQKEDRK
jgi:hypothetical protein